MRTESIYLAGGCLWGVQAFVRTLPGVVQTQAGRANGTSTTLSDSYDGYAECVRTTFAPDLTSPARLVEHLFEVIDPHSVNRQGDDEGPRYRTGVYSLDPAHLDAARAWIDARADRDLVAVEVRPLTNYVPSADEHQDRLERCPDDYCHIPHALLTKYAVS